MILISKRESGFWVAHLQEFIVQKLNNPHLIIHYDVRKKKVLFLHLPICFHLLLISMLTFHQKKIKLCFQNLLISPPLLSLSLLSFSEHAVPRKILEMMRRTDRGRYRRIWHLLCVF